MLLQLNPLAFTDSESLSARFLPFKTPEISRASTSFIRPSLSGRPDSYFSFVLLYQIKYTDLCFWHQFTNLYIFTMATASRLPMSPGRRPPSPSKYQTPSATILSPAASNPLTDIPKGDNETFVTQRGGKMYVFFHAYCAH